MQAEPIFLFIGGHGNSVSESQKLLCISEITQCQTLTNLKATGFKV